MEQRKLGNTQEKVSLICLGTMNWGEQNSEKDAHQQMDYAIDQGINFFDTAEIYPIPPHQESQGRTETYIGNWFKKTGKRDQVFLASKVVGRSQFTYARGGQVPRFDRRNILQAIDGSLSRLQTDRIDLYQLHWPDRDTNYFGKRGYKHNSDDKAIPLAETLAVLQELVEAGKIRYIGLSNETAWGVMECLRLHREENLPRIVSIQNPYSLIMRQYETDLAEMGIREQVSLLVYSPLSMGVLTGKYLDGKYPKGSRFAYNKRNHDRYNPPQAQEAIKQYVELARQYNLDPAQMALAFVNSREFVTSNIIGARTMKQLKTDIDSITVTLPPEVLDQIEQLHTWMPNPIA